jgi:aspartate kinase
MSLIVQKFGGTSVADAERIRAAAGRIAAARKKGSQVVVVASARGKTTDALEAAAHEIAEVPHSREMDMLLASGEQESVALIAMALHAMGVPAISLLAGQVGIYTDSSHTRARITRIDTRRIRRELARGNVVVVAGFQGISSEDNITTLGRGGSDTSAVALAAVLKADRCEIYTDVDGVYTADPRIVPEARKIDALSYDEVLELASMGAQVLQSRSVEFAKKYEVPMVVRSSFNTRPGTLICREISQMESIVVRGAALDENEAQVKIRAVPDKPGMAARILGTIAKAGINVDMIVQNDSNAGQGATDLTLTLPRAGLREALPVLRSLARRIGAREVTANEEIAKISVVGVGMRSHCGVAETMFRALADRKINIHLISTSEIKISVLVDRTAGKKALRAIHQAFKLGRRPPRARPAAAKRTRAKSARKR